MAKQRSSAVPVDTQEGAKVSEKKFFATSAEARAAGWFSRRYRTREEHDAAVQRFRDKKDQEGRGRHSTRRGTLALYSMDELERSTSEVSRDPIKSRLVDPGTWRWPPWKV